MANRIEIQDVTWTKNFECRLQLLGSWGTKHRSQRRPTTTRYLRPKQTQTLKLTSPTYPDLDPPANSLEVITQIAWKKFIFKKNWAQRSVEL